MNANDIDMTRRARAAFNGSVDRIDADTCLRLRDARLHAQGGHAQRTPGRRAWHVGAALTAAMALAAIVPRPLHAPDANARMAAATTDATHDKNAIDYPQAAVLDSLETVDPDMLSDLDFYGWLADRPDSNASGG